MSTNKSARPIAVTPFSLLTIAFIVLKLCGVIHWSWWWVTVPLWGPAAVSLFFYVVALFCYWMAAPSPIKGMTRVKWAFLQFGK